ncbi:hypothetical protein [Streptomyces radicis]|uniref:hypothetical protein n=1 Tax=Streptomyces radicis TaxID=1750517 RepID=UPI0016048F0B|nr:hypothetical protein [Streptomyces radicis]
MRSPRSRAPSGFTGKVLPVQRWAYSEEMWHGILLHHGFAEVEARVIEAPDPENLGTLIVQARVPRRAGEVSPANGGRRG